ncbi:MAG: UDP-N-acetylglucosamine 2-epimerase (non-hydrolyzing) [Chloroflexi bacterium]|nr:UDP-N-acetylglucosamine 2-epimerase (non-hydrolyzing) [Chloroflexota bacterium]
MMKIISVFGTRPEAVKMAPVVAELKKHAAVESKVLVTAQHRDMLDQVLDIFGIAPDYDLDVMQDNQTPTDVAAEVLRRIQPILRDERPDWILVQGDTTTVLAASLAAFYNRVKVGHVEAGLRTYDRYNPFPEEINRVLADQLSDLHFAPTETAKRALLKEAIPPERIHVTGNTVIDALRFIVSRPLNGDAPPGDVPPERLYPSDKRLVLVTAHRRENFGRPFANMLAALKQIADRPDVHLLYPVHPNPNVRGPAHEVLGAHPHVTLLPPMDYLSFAHLMGKAHLILTDSGGIQEEAPGLGVPVLVMRVVTERPEAVEAGTAKLVGTDTATIVREAMRLLDDPAAHAAMAQAVNPFGDGHAAERIVQLLLQSAAVSSQ